MGSLVRRGSRANPKWFVKYKDADGRYKMRLSHQPTREQARKYLAQIEARVAAGKIGIEEAPDSDAVLLAGELLEQWAETLSNRNARDDRSRVKLHLVPKFKGLRLSEISVAMLLDWVDQQRKPNKRSKRQPLGEGSIRHNLNILSRFFAWAIERGHAEVNPVRQIPQGKRPTQPQKRDVPWLEDDSLVPELMDLLPEPVDLMFYLGNRSGLRTGEIAGLRMADLGYLAEGAIRVRYSYDGPLKEDKRKEGKVKWVPAAEDAESVLGPWLDRRKREGARGEALVFPCSTRGNGCYGKRFVERAWDDVRPHLEQDLTWYQATRHTFTTRGLEAGASLDEVSAALGHSSPVVTKRYYDHFIRKSFSSTLRRSLGGGPTEPSSEADIIPLAAKRRIDSG